MNIINSFRNCISAAKNFVSDRLWVLQAYLRGKVLRQKAYRPQGNMFRLPVPVTAKRVMMLMKWWGFRPMTVAELTQLMADQSFAPKSDQVPFLEWDRSEQKWNVCDSPSERWGSQSAFLPVRK